MNTEIHITKFEANCKSKDLMNSDVQKVLDEILPRYKGIWKSSMSKEIKDSPTLSK
jgi:uncharacterized protein